MDAVGIQLLLVIALIIAVPGVLIWTTRKQLRTALAQADYWRHEHDANLQALDATQRKAINDYRTRPHPPTAQPVGLMPILQRLQQEYPKDRFALGVGWEEIGGQPSIVAVSMHGESPIKANHSLLTAEPDMGKDTPAFAILMQLCLRNITEDLRIFIIDGKGADGNLWRGKAHNWHEPVTDTKQIDGAMKRLRTEREARQNAKRHNVLKWEDLPTGVRPPLLMVYVSELSALELGTDDLEDWLTTELALCRACGIRYLIGTQTVANRKTSWRSQIGCFIAGPQSARAAIEPNIGVTADEIREAGAIPQTQLPGAGYFTIRVRTDFATVRAAKIDLDERKAWLAKLPIAVDIDSSAPASAPVENSSEHILASLPGLHDVSTTEPPVAVSRPYDLWAGNGVQKLSEGELRAHPLVIQEVLAQHERLQHELGDKYSRRKLTAAVFYPACEDGFKANPQQYVITPIADEHGLRFPTDKPERNPEQSETNMAARIAA